MLKLQIPGKESASIAYHLFPATAPTTPGRMVVFLNGMMGPQMTWHPVIKAYLASYEVRYANRLLRPNKIYADSRVLALSAFLPTIDTPSSMVSPKIRTLRISDHSDTTWFKSPKTWTLS